MKKFFNSWPVKVLVTVCAFGFLLGAVSNFDDIVLSGYLSATDSVTTAKVTSTGAFQVADSLAVKAVAASKTMVFRIDSLGYDSETAIAVFRPWRDITITEIGVYSLANATDETCQVYIRSEPAITAKTVYIPTSASEGRFSTAFDIAADTACTLFADDGGIDGTGDGKNATRTDVLLFYRDD